VFASLFKLYGLLILLVCFYVTFFHNFVVCEVVIILLHWLLKRDSHHCCDFELFQFESVVIKMGAGGDLTAVP